MSGLTDVLTVALGSGGTATTLLAGVRAWLGTRGRHNVRITIERGGKSVVIDDKLSSGEIEAILRDIMTDQNDKSEPLQAPRVDEQGQ
jgi:hypothetical protein